jgi:hypothetical protein
VPAPTVIRLHQAYEGQLVKVRPAKIPGICYAPAKLPKPARRVTNGCAEPNCPLTCNGGAVQHHRRRGRSLRRHDRVTDTTDAQVVVATRSGTCPFGFGCGNTSGQYCGWHDATEIAGGVPFTNLPYQSDSPNCDGVTITAGHEYAESITDPYPPPAGGTWAAGLASTQRPASSPVLPR